MQIRKVIRRRLRHEEEGVQVAGDVHVAIAANVESSGGRMTVRSASGGPPEQRDVPSAAEDDATDRAGGPARSSEEGGSHG